MQLLSLLSLEAKFVIYHFFSFHFKFILFFFSFQLIKIGNPQHSDPPFVEAKKKVHNFARGKWDQNNSFTHIFFQKQIRKPANIKVMLQLSNLISSMLWLYEDNFQRYMDLQKGLQATYSQANPSWIKPPITILKIEFLPSQLLKLKKRQISYTEIILMAFSSIIKTLIFLL